MLTKPSIFTLYRALRSIARPRCLSLSLMAAALLLSVIVPAIPARADGLILIEGVYRQPAVSHI